MSSLESRLYPLLVSSLSLGFVAAGIALMFWMLATTIGPFEFFRSATLRTGPTALWLPADGAIGSEGRIAAWREMWPELSNGTNALRESLERGEILNAGTPLVVIPDARHLDLEETERLESFVRAGGSAVVVGAIATETKDGADRGHEAMRELLRVESVRTVPLSASRALYAGVRGPLNESLAPNETLHLRGQEGLLALRDPESELRWRLSGVAAASRRLEIGTGRLVWLAVGPHHQHRRDTSNQDTFADTLHRAVAWARREPTLALLPWPDGAPFAGEVVLDRRGPLRDSEGLREALLADIEAARSRARHVLLYVPVAALGEEAALTLTRDIDTELKRRGAWVSSSDEAWAWERSRGKVAVMLETVGPRRVLVRVTNRGGLDVTKVGLRVRVNHPFGAISISPTNLGQAVPELRHRPGAESADFVIADLAAGESLAYSIDFRTSSALW